MMKKWSLYLISLLLWATGLAYAQPKSTLPSAIPATVLDAFTKAQVPMDNVAILVKEVGAREAIIAHNIDKPMNPASVMKLVTTYAGLELLGPAYSWKTDVYVAGEMRGGTLNGDLVFKGSGDPKLTVERFWLILKQLRERGLKTINGDLVLDKTFFGVVETDPSKFDGESTRAYNVGPDALLLNFKSVRFQFAPAIDDKSVSISPDVKPAQLEIINRTKLIDAPCGDWRERIKNDIQTVTPTQLQITFTGNYPRSCGERAWNISLLDHSRFIGGVFASMWSDVGGIWKSGKGAVKLAPTPKDAKLILTSESPALSEVVRDINKFSNNVMARQLFLTLSGETDKQPATTARSLDIVRGWLARKNIVAPELVIENGSGLSRIERISTSTLAQILDGAWRSAVMPEFISSLSLVGVDGTFRRRSRTDIVAGNAHMKSGTLNDVRAIAGYVLASDEKRYIMVMIANHNNAIFSQPAQDALLQWVYARALPALPPVPQQ
jgi:serine-type D-Ala-D-Ala carboxypeptidase/endopeptidase (penicillin-binding protein 4)